MAHTSQDFRLKQRFTRHNKQNIFVKLQYSTCIVHVYVFFLYISHHLVVSMTHLLLNCLLLNKFVL